MPSSTPESHDPIDGACLLSDLLITPFRMVKGSQENASSKDLALGCLSRSQQPAKALFFFSC
jgi:hypothetical protein